MKNSPDEKKIGFGSIISSSKHASNPYWDYFIDIFRLQGSIQEYHYIRSTDSVMIIPLLDSGKVAMVRQWRLPSKSFSLEFPGGGIREGESPLLAASRELKEETGYDAQKFTIIGTVQPCNGLSSELCTIFLAEMLAPGKSNPDETEQLEIMTLSSKELRLAFQSGVPLDSVTVAAWFLYISKQDVE